VIEFARKRAAPTEASGAESWSPEWAEAGEEDPDASTAGGADASRRGGEAGEGAAVGMSVGLARLGEATVGEAMPVDAGTDRKTLARKLEATVRRLRDVEPRRALSPTERPSSPDRAGENNPHAPHRRP